MNFADELISILRDDPLGLLKTRPKSSGVISADARLIASFQEISKFVKEHDGHEPTESRNIQERKLYSRLQGLRDHPEKAAALKEYDAFGLLADVVIPEEQEINTIEDILSDDSLGILDDRIAEDADPTDIFKLKHVPKTIEMPDRIARRKPCEDFDKFEPLFTQCHADLVSGEKEMRQFTGEQQIAAGHFFILHGVMVYVSEVGEKKRKRGKVNAELRCIFENGTESNMLLRSLATELYKDEGGRRILNPRDDLFEDPEQITDQDKVTGSIYVLRSLSQDPQISTIENLFKIGYSTKPVHQRIKNASQEATYLMADVQVVTEFQTYNLNPQKLEYLLHTLFADSCLNLDVHDKNGNRHSPKEWFIVPLNVITTAVRMLINGEVVHYRYDSQRQELVEKG